MLLKFGDGEDSWESLGQKDQTNQTSKRNQLWIFIEKTEAEAPILWPLDAKSQLIGTGKDWGQEEKWVTEDGWHHWLNKHEFEQILGDGKGQAINWRLDWGSTRKIGFLAVGISLAKAQSGRDLGQWRSWKKMHYIQSPLAWCPKSRENWSDQNWNPMYDNCPRRPKSDMRQSKNDPAGNKRCSPSPLT